VPSFANAFGVEAQQMLTSAQAKEFIISVIVQRLRESPVFLDEIQMFDPDLLTALIYVRN
jgi:hypothetical protein